MVPGESFFDGKTDGIYLLYMYQWKINIYFENGIMIASLVGLIALGLTTRFSRSQLKSQIDVWLGVLNLLVVGGYIFFIFMAVDIGPPFLHYHMDTRESSGHIYHVAMNGAGVSTCPTKSYCGKVVYVIIKCDERGFICHREAGVETEFPMSLEATVKFAQASNGLQLVRYDASEVLWESSEP